MTLDLSSLKKALDSLQRAVAEQGFEVIQQPSA